MQGISLNFKKGRKYIENKRNNCSNLFRQKIKRQINKNIKKEVCNNCINNDICKYKNISKFENGKVFNNNVECGKFYFITIPKAILTIGRNMTTGKTTTKTFVGKDEQEAYNKTLTEKLKL